MNKVQIFQVTKRVGATSPWLVKWRVAGHDKTHAFANKTLADNFRRRLQTAHLNDESFSSVTGLPDSWSGGQRTFAECASEYTEANWDIWESASRRSTVEALANSVLLLVRGKNMPCSRSDMAKSVREFLLKPNERFRATGKSKDAISWILKYSLHLSEIDGKLLKNVLASMNETLDKKSQVKPSTLRKRRQALNGVLEHAIDQKYLRQNPLTRVKFKGTQRDVAMNPTEVLAPQECRRLLEELKSCSRHGVLTSTFVACIWLAGLRPSEVAALRPRDILIDAEGNGEIHVTRAIVEVGKAWSRDGSAKTLKQPKARQAGHIRVVPILEELIPILAKYMSGLQPDELLFKGPRTGGAVSLSMIEENWAKVRTSPHTLYDLRHANASLLIYGGCNLIEVAERLGNSEEVCSRVYLHLINGQQKKANEKVNGFLRAN